MMPRTRCKFHSADEQCNRCGPRLFPNAQPVPPGDVKIKFTNRSGKPRVILPLCASCERQRVAHMFATFCDDCAPSDA